jgi:hypothetical protein
MRVLKNEERKSKLFTKFHRKERQRLNHHIKGKIVTKNQIKSSNKECKRL